MNTSKDVFIEVLCFLMNIHRTKAFPRNAMKEIKENTRRTIQFSEIALMSSPFNKNVRRIRLYILHNKYACNINFTVLMNSLPNHIVSYISKYPSLLNSVNICMLHSNLETICYFSDGFRFYVIFCNSDKLFSYTF